MSFTAPHTSSLKKTHDLVVLSDLHLGEGRPAGDHRYAPTEDFFHDLAFGRFLEFLIGRYAGNPSCVVLVLNGDTFDFLTVTKVPSDEEAQARNMGIHSSERRFGLNATPSKSEYKLDVIFEGHRLFFEALSKFIAAGHSVEIIRGNHDVELYFENVRERIRHHLASFDTGASRKMVDRLVTFHQLFYRETGRVHIEHGHQYDSSNSIRHPLRPIHTDKRWWQRDDETEVVLDYPIGSIFVKFFYNRVRRLDPYSPRLLSPEQYIEFIRRYNLFDVWRVSRDHYPFFIAALGPGTTIGSSRSTDEDEAREAEDFEKLEAEQHSGNLFRRLN